MTNMIVKEIDPAVKADIAMVCDEENVRTYAKALKIIMKVYREKKREAKDEISINDVR